MKFINFAVVKFSILLTIGILTAHFTKSHHSAALYVLLLLLVFLLFSWILSNRQLYQNNFFGIITYLSFFSLGFCSYQLQTIAFEKYHYSNTIEINDSSKFKSKLIELKIKEILKSSLYQYKYIAETVSIDAKKVTGKILLNINKDSCFRNPVIDEHLIITAPIVEIKHPLNPHQFDYSRYMYFLGVSNQISISESAIIQIQKGEPTLRGKAEFIRNNIIEKLASNPFTKNELSVIQALILGQRRDIGKELYADYAAAGAIHILAVSGLHVGIIYLIFSFLLSFLNRFSKGIYIKSLLLLSILWCFAIIAGLSPSVVRAVTMFSFFTLAQNLNRPTNSFNTLFLSYFILLIINPFWIFHVGFQMSYLAVFFILWIQPKLYKYYQPKYYLDKLTWGILTVTFSAQIGILPISLYYYHQFPGLSFLTNLLILPFLGLILGGGIIIITLALLDSLPTEIASFYNSIIEVLNYIVSWIANQNTFVIKDISFSEKHVFGTYFLLISIVLLWKNKTYKRVLFTLSSVAVFVALTIWETQSKSENQMIVFHKNRHTILGIKKAKELEVYKFDSIQNYKNGNPLKGYRIFNDIKKYEEKPMPSIFSYNQKTILIIDSLGVYPAIKNVDVIVLIESPKINLNRLIDSLQPKLIIANSSNYKSYKDRWNISCLNRNVSYHDTYVNGAYILN